ncbi:MAG: GNAT family N-acetyltransferase [bacterium]|nr:GNAT family N-acetyltransferase [bacterium]
MANKIELRYQEISDAKRFYKILDNPKFIYLSAKPKSIKDEEEFLELNEQKRKDKKEFNYSIVYNNELIGAIGLMIDQKRNYIAELGYFVDEKYWNKGFASEAMLLIEKIAFEDLKIKRIEIMMITENKASERIAIKCGYEKEGISKKKIKVIDKYYDCYLYAKVTP